MNQFRIATYVLASFVSRVSKTMEYRAANACSACMEECALNVAKCLFR